MIRERTMHTPPERPRVLLAEDDDELRGLLAVKLSQRGMEVVPCRHGLELVEKLERAFGAGGADDIDLVITDIRMPGVTGTSILEGLNAFGPHCPVILMTAFGDDQVHAQARRLCAAALFDKPFDVEAMLDSVQNVLERERRWASAWPKDD